MRVARCELLEPRRLLSVAPPVIDLLVVYTPAAASAIGGGTEIQRAVQLAVDEMNLQLQSSEIPLSVRLVHSESINYSGSGDLFVDRLRLDNPNDGFLDSVHPLRNQYGADVVALITDGNVSGGNADLLSDLSLTNNDTRAFTAISYNQLFAGSYTFAHEIGHIIGAGHERGNTIDPARGPFSYSYGFRFTAEGVLYHDIMSYDPGLGIPLYANPAVSFRGTPTGSAIGNPNEADLASTFAVTGPYVAAYRAAVVSDNISPIAQVSEINRTGPSLTFTVRYSDDAGIDVSTIDSNDIMVSGPGGWSLPATLVSIAHPNTGGAIKFATYQLTLPATNPATTALTFTVNAGAIKDFANHSVASGAIPKNSAHNAGVGLAWAQDMGTLTPGVTRSEFGKFDARDGDQVYRFTLTSPATISATMTGLSQNADFFIVHDDDNDGTYNNFSEIRVQGFESGTADEDMSKPLPAGTYYLWTYELNNDTLPSHTPYAITLRAYTDVTPPTASLDATDIKTAGAPSVDFAVTYSDDNDLDGETTRYWSALDVHAQLSNGADFTFVYYPDPGLNGSAQAGGASKAIYYRILAFDSGTGWTANDNGTYTLSIHQNTGTDPRVHDGAGNNIPLLTLGSFKIAIGSGDSTAPTASIAPGTVGPVAGQSTWQFSVVYHDNVAIDGNSVDGNDIRVTGPGGFSQAATLVSLSAAPTIGSNRIATYQVTAPGGFWDGTDDGSYAIAMQSNQVRDAANNFIAAGPIGSPFVTSMPNLVAQSTGTVAFIGTSSADVMRFDADPSFVYFNLNDVNLWYIAKTFVAHAAINGGAAGSDTINIRRGVIAGTISGANVSLSVTTGATFTIEATPHLAALTVAGNVSLAPGGNKVLVTKSLSIPAGGVLDLFDNDLILDYSGATQLSAIQSFINAARAGGAWTGSGLSSTSARLANPKNKTLGAIEASAFKSIYGPTALFAGESLDATAVLVKYTYYGDADFNGVVNFDDYSRTDAGFNGNKSGWLNGDFDGNGVVNFDDYSLIDLAFNTQTTALRPPRAALPSKASKLP